MTECSVLAALALITIIDMISNALLLADAEKYRHWYLLPTCATISVYELKCCFLQMHCLPIGEKTQLFYLFLLI